ncbi:hypothetical protein [Leucobacter sp. OH1287]|uniref:hypothetical protein n=1 Tax=Leucobacter sp. OH1287 TaxID=2491049 RepID=UPI000F5D6C29|nr:hypothetical protein [Leucobacter sp. OH1287]RRD61353.1 hypothetical protein EII30_02850 [Leucobacter sp. OH1287]
MTKVTGSIPHEVEAFAKFKPTLKTPFSVNFEQLIRRHQEILTLTTAVENLMQRVGLAKRCKELAIHDPFQQALADLKLETLEVELADMERLLRSRIFNLGRAITNYHRIEQKPATVEEANQLVLEHEEYLLSSRALKPQVAASSQRSTHPEIVAAGKKEGA